ncbi:hypothetical protein ACFVVM_19325 [Nocardia sp. NPDC058176]|uniref:hypothetical protein n=1 Tax=Nocardia sp. NPDC058176 TaxID=3346368 RepID=UPI0036DEDD8A
MSFDLVVWEGERPGTDVDAMAVVTSLSEYLEGRLVRDVRADPPTPPIAEFVAALLRRWPDSDASSPWATSGTGDADGSSLQINIRWGPHDEVAAFVAGLAKVHGLVCFDPQVGRLRP